MEILLGLFGALLGAGIFAAGFYVGMGCGKQNHPKAPMGRNKNHRLPCVCAPAGAMQASPMPVCRSAMHASPAAGGPRRVAEAGVRRAARGAGCLGQPERLSSQQSTAPQRTPQSLPLREEGAAQGAADEVKPEKNVTPESEADAAERLRREEEKRAFDALMGYSADVAYGNTCLPEA